MVRWIDSWIDGLMEWFGWLDGWLDECDNPLSRSVLLSFAEFTVLNCEQKLNPVWFSYVGAKAIRCFVNIALTLVVQTYMGDVCFK